VIPFFQNLINDGASELPITDERMTRFWITLEQGVAFVLSCLEMMQGGEIFVPKITSMRVADIALCMAPDLPHKNIGVRAGEKLHEVMISEDDARSTVELADRYAILAPFLEDRYEAYVKMGASPMVGDFRYASDTNTVWPEAEELRRMIGDL